MSDDIREDRMKFTIDIINANKGEEPFVSREAFQNTLMSVYDTMLHGGSDKISREDLVSLLASHHWDSFEQRRMFKAKTFAWLYDNGELSSRLDHLPLHDLHSTVAGENPGIPDDMLGDMLMQQRNHMIEYQQKYLAKNTPICVEHEWGRINYSNTQRAIRETNNWLIEELMEAQNLLKDKPWKINPQITDADKYHKEIGDAIHFFLELLIYSGLDTSEKVWAVYNERSANNTARRATDY
jgi:hypothetical protein